jgi:uncharacterized protein YutE (UPF0331/DUF86 family)
VDESGFESKDMTPGVVSSRVVSRRLKLIQDLLDRIRARPLDSLDAFLADSDNYPVAESCLRRSLEALLDIGRHILAKGYGTAASEYKEIPKLLRKHDVITEDEARTLHTLAGYRNRMVHFYYDVTEEELYQICVHELGDVEQIADAFRRWVKQHPDKMEQA